MLMLCLLVYLNVGVPVLSLHEITEVRATFRGLCTLREKSGVKLDIYCVFFILFIFTFVDSL